jgi:beta-glucosidase
VVLFNGRPLDLSDVVEAPDAILEAWFPGTEAGNGIADVLTGAYNPSGKITMTFPRSLGQVPLFYNQKNTGRPINEKEKYTSKYLDIPNTPLFPFGYGLSYTTFSYGAPTISKKALGMKDSLQVSVVVTNTGKLAGHEVVQLYVQDLVGSVTRPVKELKGFQKILLAPGQAQTVTFTIHTDDLRFYTQDMRFVAEPGAFKAMVGPNSADVQAVDFELK